MSKEIYYIKKKAYRLPNVSRMILSLTLWPHWMMSTIATSKDYKPVVCLSSYAEICLYITPSSTMFAAIILDSLFMALWYTKSYQKNYVLHVCFRLGHSNVFICFASFENPKTYQLAREKNKQEKITKIHADILELCMSHINNKELESTN
jgi:hypothetical protein